MITATLEQAPQGGDRHKLTRSMARRTALSRLAISRTRRSLGPKPDLARARKPRPEPQFPGKVREVAGLPVLRWWAKAGAANRLAALLVATLVAFALAGCGSGAQPNSGSGQQAAQQPAEPGSGSGPASAGSGTPPSDGAPTGAYVPPSTAANNLNEVINNNGQANSQLPSSNSLEAFMTAVIKDVAADWNTRFQQNGLSYTFPDYNWVSGSDIVQAGGQCGTAGDPDLNQNSGSQPSQAFACPSDLTVYISVQWANDHLWQPHLNPQTGQIDPGGTMAVGVVIAHEMTHIAQFELGITPPPGATDVSSTELQADCGAGVWTNDKYYSGQLQPGDIQVAEQTMTEVGDYEFGNQQHHGTPNQRREAFDLGYNSGQMSDCTLNLPQALPF
jgi:predicted metalloprotease